MNAEGGVPQIPKWVPRGVIRAAHMLLFAGPSPPPETAALIGRLLFDPRMENVWRELGRRDRSTSARSLFHTVTLPAEADSWLALAKAAAKAAVEDRELGNEGAAVEHERLAISATNLDRGATATCLTPEQVLGRALIVLFFRAIAFYGQRITTVTAKEVESLARQARAKGKHEIASAIERKALEPNNARFINVRSRTDRRQEAFIESMAISNEGMFGYANASTIATVSNVAFQTDHFNRDRVRAILKRRSKKSASAA